MRWASKAAEIFVIIAIVASLTVLAFYFWLRPRAGLYRIGEHFPAPTGYLPNGRALVTAARRCYLLRVTAVGCEFCRQDQPEYRRLSAAARQSGCEVFDVAPKPEWEGAVQPGDLQLEYIAMPLGRALIPYITPQTLLVAADTELVWYRVGAMDGRSLQGGLGAVRKLGGAR